MAKTITIGLVADLPDDPNNLTREERELTLDTLLDEGNAGNTRNWINKSKHKADIIWAVGELTA